MNESLLGFGCVYSITDYGEHKKFTDNELIDKVRDSESFIQACKIAKDDGTLCDHVGIFCNNNGYSVRPVYNEDSTKKDIDMTQGTLAI